MTPRILYLLLLKRGEDLISLFITIFLFPGMLNQILKMFIVTMRILKESDKKN
jgi:hypothetical protein